MSGGGAGCYGSGRRQTLTRYVPSWARTREVKLCCCFTQTSPDDQGRPVRDPASSSYLATFAPAAPFGILMAGEARRRRAAHIRQLVILGDGAPWIWNLASQRGQGRRFEGGYALVVQRTWAGAAASAGNG